MGLYPQGVKLFESAKPRTVKCVRVASALPNRIGHNLIIISLMLIQMWQRRYPSMEGNWVTTLPIVLEQLAKIVYLTENASDVLSRYNTGHSWLRSNCFKPSRGLSVSFV